MMVISRLTESHAELTFEEIKRLPKQKIRSTPAIVNGFLPDLRQSRALELVYIASFEFKTNRPSSGTQIN